MHQRVAVVVAKVLEIPAPASQEYSISISSVLLFLLLGKASLTQSLSLAQVFLVIYQRIHLAQAQLCPLRRDRSENIFLSFDDLFFRGLGLAREGEEQLGRGPFGLFVGIKV
jgi:hypothetical protein